MSYKGFRSELVIQEIFPNLYKIEIPLPGNPLKAVNSYVIKSSECNLIIDTGMNREECMTSMQAALRKLEVDFAKTQIFLTHLHIDHFGLVSKLATPATVIYFSRPDADWIKSGANWHTSINFAGMSGFPEDEIQPALDSHPGNKYGSSDHLAFTILKGGDTINVGEYVLKCIETSGHTRGHMCLYEPNRKVLVAGDHILDSITPTIQLWSDFWNPLKEYFKSLDTVYDLDIDLVLPGHKEIFANGKERIRELKDHHKKRAEEILSILENGSKNAYQIASQMSWDISYEFWDLTPVVQKWFATGEAIAHLKYLEEQGMVRREMKRDKIMFSLNVNHPISQGKGSPK